MPTPPVAPSQSPVVKRILTDITVVLASIATVGEAVLQALPAGSVTTAFQVGLPVLVALVAGLRLIGD